LRSRPDRADPHYVHFLRFSGFRAVAGLTFLTLLASSCSSLIDVKDIHLDDTAHPGGEGGIGGEGGNIDEGGPGSDEGGADAPVTCNADLTSDLKNCGACGHDCTNGLCKEGLCILAQNVVSPNTLTVRQNVYVGALGGLSNGAILSCPTNGCASATVAAKTLNNGATQIYPWHVVANDTYVFSSDYSSSNKGGVWRTLATGGDLQMLPPGVSLERGYGAAIDDTTVYWITTGVPGAVHWCALPNCPTLMTAATIPNDGEWIAVGANGALVWSENQGSLLKRCVSKTSCTPAALVTTNWLGFAEDLTIDGNVAYWGTNLGEILSCSTAGCANATTLVTEDPKAVIGALAVSGTSLYWSSMPFAPDGNNVIDTDGKIKTCTLPKCGPNDIKTIATMQHDPNAMALDAKSVYWANSGKRGYSDGIGNVVKAAR
jgi:hypothetical protein